MSAFIISFETFFIQKNCCQQMLVLIYRFLWHCQAQFIYWNCFKTIELSNWKKLKMAWLYLSYMDLKNEEVCTGSSVEISTSHSCRRLRIKNYLLCFSGLDFWGWGHQECSWGYQQAPPLREVGADTGRFEYLWESSSRVSGDQTTGLPQILLCFVCWSARYPVPG